ncbi:hypothetical protein R1sor_011497 [Riccia sorocarpa]|uniref:Glycosyltransferase n=1 Tax=Riccia sorocarpa TaxID=122646 RepID=A0ABD3I5B1_9MARC
MKHALVIPLAAQGHVAATYRLSLQLARRGVTITFVTLANDVPNMKAYEELQGLDFRIISYPPSLAAAPSAAGFSAFGDLMKASGVHFKPILDDLKEFEGSLSVPGLPPLTYADLPTGSVCARPQLGIAIGKGMEKAEGIIVNTFYELEYPQVDEIERRLVEQASTSGSKKTELFLVGPLSNAANFKNLSFSRIGLKAGKLEHDTKGVESLQWLYSQPPHSVLYICMGSVYDWNPSQVNELALALESSGQRFLWVLPVGGQIASLDAVLPAGFEERMRSRGIGLVATGWVPQLQILTQSAVGGFLTHCGWNSSIESISAGVPLICWPQVAEQHLNRKYIVDVLKIGVDLGPRVSGSTFVRHEEFEKAVRFLMVEDEGKAMRSKVRELMLTASAAVTAGGASSRALDELSKRIPGNCTNLLH